MKQNILKVLNLLFQNLLIVYLVMLLVNEFEMIFYPYVTNTLLVIVLILGVISALFYKPEEEKRERTTFDTIFIMVLGIVGAVLVFLKTRDLGYLSYVISAISGILIMLLGFLVYEEDEDIDVPIQVDRKHILVIGGIITGLTVGLSFIYGMQVFRVVFGSIYVLFLPGFSLSYAFFEKDKIDMLERVALSFALSIAVVPLVVFYLNLIGMPINFFSVASVVLFIIVLGYILYKKKPFKNARLKRYLGNRTQ